MECRKSGRTGLGVSILSFGASTPGGAFRDVDQDSAGRTVSSPLDRGNTSRNCHWIDETVDEALLAEVREILAPVGGRTWSSGLPQKY